MKTITLFIYSIVIVLVLSCSSNNKSFEINKSITREIDLVSDSLFMSSCMIELETSSDCKLGKNTNIIYADDSLIILSSCDHVYKFNSKGKFIKEIGRLGNGHGEHGKIASCTFDRIRKEIYICMMNNQMCIYDVNGVFKKKIDISDKGLIRCVAYTNELGLLGIKYEYNSNGLVCDVVFFNGKGEKKKELPLYKDNLSFSVSIESFPIIYEYNKMLKIKLPFEDKLISLNKQLEFSATEFGLGDLAPNRRHIEDCDKRNELYRKVQVLDIKESSRHLYLLCFYSMNYYAMIIDKVDYSIKFNKKIENPKMHGAIQYKTYANIRFWPSYISNGMTYCLINDISPEIYKKLPIRKSSNDDYKEGKYNPIILIFKEK